VRPLVYLLRPSLNLLLPAALRLDVCHALGYQDAHDLGIRYRAKVLGNDKVDRVVDVGQPVAVEVFDRHLAVQAERADVGTRLIDVLDTSIEAVHEITVAGAQSGGELAVTAPNVNDEAALDVGSGQDAARRSLFGNSGSDGCQRK
jgi:hypothetical protein